MRIQQTALDTLAREELGIDPEESDGSAWAGAITSFLLFAVGEIIPVRPYFIVDGTTSVAASVGLSVIGLLAISGAAITIITGRNALVSERRQVLSGVAAAITFGVGRLVGANLGGQYEPHW